MMIKSMSNSSNHLKWTKLKSDGSRVQLDVFEPSFRSLVIFYNVTLGQLSVSITVQNDHARTISLLRLTIQN
jgi:hypothetical protein